METPEDPKLYHRRNTSSCLKYFAVIVTLLLIGQSCFITWLWVSDKVSLTPCLCGGVVGPPSLREKNIEKMQVNGNPGIGGGNCEPVCSCTTGCGNGPPGAS